jgi:lipopolysaccharide export system protein LptA
MPRPLVLVCLLTLLAAPAAARAQDTAGRNPIEITADQGIEWDRDARRYIARGNVRVIRGERTVHADKITAYARGDAMGRNDIYRIDAEGNVRVLLNDSVITGDHLVWDNDNRIARMTGRNLTMTNPDGRLTARDSIEYWDEKRMAVARGNVVLVRENEEMRADQVVAWFEKRGGQTADTKGPGGKQRLDRIEAFGHVYIASCQGYAHSDKGRYDPNTGTAVLTGNVRLTRGSEQVNGEAVEMNTKSGDVRMVAGTGGRVTALLEPNKEAATPDPRPTDRPGTKPCPDKQKTPAPDQGGK